MKRGKGFFTSFLTFRNSGVNNSQDMKTVGLLGEHLSHSYSKELHEKLGAPYEYTLCPLPRQELSAFLEKTVLDGFNVTIPYKKEILPYLSGMSDIAARLGSVNTVLRKENGFWGYNTDYAGFSYLLSQSRISVSGEKVLVLGNGGVCPTVCAVLSDRGAVPVVISRRGENNYGNLGLHRDACLIVNTTPVGMYPDNGKSPVSLDGFLALRGVIDLIYNPFETALLAEARARGLTAVCGISMLAAQAKQAMLLFANGSPGPVNYPDADVERVSEDMVKTMRNIILIGMPGSGKTMLGRRLAARLGREFRDADAEFTKKYGITPAEMLTQEGETAFREKEHNVLAALCAGSRLVISTGGGCVTREDNYAPMASNGIILYLDRPVKALSVRGRPLSQRVTPEELYKIRAPLYRRFADTVVGNDADFGKVLGRLTAAAGKVPYTTRTVTIKNNG